MKRKALFLSIIFHSLLLIVVYIFQGMIFPFVRLNGLIPLLLPIASTGIALYEGRDTGGIAGLFAGILCDVSFNQPIGVFTVFLTLSGLVVGTMADAAILPGFITYYISVAAVLILSAGIQMVPFIVSQSSNVTLAMMLPTAIEQTLYSLVLAFPIWFFVRAIGKWTERMSPSGRTH